jgi:hypothetical protein
MIKNVNFWAKLTDKDRQKEYIDNMTSETNGMSLELQSFRNDLIAQGLSPAADHYKQAELLLAQALPTSHIILRYYGYNEQEKQTIGLYDLKEVNNDIEPLDNEINAALILDNIDPARGTDVNLIRSAKMLENLYQWAPKILIPTVWKVGESHITDFDILREFNAPFNSSFTYINEANYLKAYIELVKPIRDQEYANSNDRFIAGHWG